MNNDRPRISSTWLSGAVGAGVLLALAAAYPRSDMQTRQLTRLPPDPLSVAYLEAWLQLKPDSPDYLNLLANQYMGLGNWAGARTAAEKLAHAGTAPMRARALMIEVTAAEREAYALPGDDPRRAQRMAEYIGLLGQTVQQPWDVPVMRALAEKARAAGATGVMLHYYRQLAALDALHASQWHEKLGDAAFAQQAYADAAYAYFAAQEEAGPLEDKRRYFLAALRVLESGNQIALACDEGERRAGALAQDAQTLRYLLDLARQGQRTDLMTRYARALTEPAAQTERAQPQGDLHPASFGIAPAGGDPARGGAAPLYLDGYRALHRPGSARDAYAGVHVQRIAAAAPVPLAEVPTRPRAMPQTPGAPGSLNAKDYDLAFRAFVESSRLDDAEQIAQQALARHLDPLIWTRRLAQVAQWNRHPALALKYWLAYAQASGNEEAWANVLKMAPQLNDDPAYLAALVHSAERAPSDLALRDRVVSTYERLGQSGAALDYLKRHATGAQQQALLERHAQLAERIGDTDTALRSYRQLQGSANAGADAGARYAIRIANIYYQTGRIDAAFTALREARGSAQTRPEDALYWRVYGELARLTQHDEDANFAYRKLLATGRASSPDLNGMSYFYQGYPIDAGRVAELQFRRDGSDAALQTALYSYTAAHAWPRVQALLSSLTPAQQAHLERTSLLLAQRAEYYRQTGHAAAAMADLRRAATLPGASEETQVAYLWLLVDQGSDEELRVAMQYWHDAARADAVYWGVFSAAELRMNNPDGALVYLRTQATRARPDPLWMLTLADAHEAAGHDEQAWSIRRQVWRAMLAARADGAVSAPGAAAPGVATPGVATPGVVTPDAAAPDANARLAGGGYAIGRLASARVTAMSGTATLAERLAAARVALSQKFASGDQSQALLMQLLKTGVRSGERGETATLLGNAPALGLPEGGRQASPADAPQPQSAASAAAAAPMATQTEATQDGDAAGAAGAHAHTVQPPRPVLGAVATDVAMAWAMSGERNELARTWLARQYAHRLLRPADAEITLALAADDRDTLDRLLDTRQGRIPVDSRIDALNRTGRGDEAATLAFAAGEGAGDNDALHETMSDTLLRERPQLGADLAYTRLSPLAYVQSSVLGGVDLSNRIGLALEAIQRNQRSVDAGQLARVPMQDREFRLSVQERTADRALTMTLGHRDALTSFYTFSMHGDFNRAGPLTASIAAGYNQFSDLSPQLQVAGSKDMVELGLQWHDASHWFAQGSAEFDRFHAQQRSYLGHGVSLTAEAGYRLSTAYPDWNVRMMAARGMYWREHGAIAALAPLLPPGVTPDAALFMPQDVTQYGVLAGFGRDDENVLQRAWRPYLNVGLVHDSNQGWGPQVDTGIAGSVFGRDRARLYYVHEAVAGSGAALTQFGISYRMYY